MTAAFDEFSSASSTHPGSTSTGDNNGCSPSDVTPGALWRGSERTTSSNSITLESITVGMENTSLSDPSPLTAPKGPSSSESDDETDVDPALRARIEYTRILHQYTQRQLDYSISRAKTKAPTVAPSNHERS
ncbi:hypothetical protein POJ06DRAFT_10226 [Lipomyces tetrasporus]|uniref:Uncharacterized protein n=1 Tax=Lipomyces tetrasporus TaxID=54092 RepID=A0AAD7VVX4_9ASCO|nr:uncharacterized protein POJ06DRAFT_10226 [Lipomyces tetrasporus]KAJ8103973.1 hypothetical protein POJ06DRAFT_10226 [Lipomyces tetrasporus]